MPSDRKDLQLFLRQLPAAEAVTWIGLGSNLLVRDGGIRGAVICVHRALQGIRLLENDLVYVEAGLTMAKLARFAQQHQLSGVEFAGGVPGTVGGALAMNAGAFGQETWDVVQKLVMLNRQGEIIERQKSEFQVAYRQVKVRANEWFIGAYLQLRRDDRKQVRAQIRSLIVQRNQKQPIGTANAGSVFRNPPGLYAARLIEQAGMKGTRIGGACISKKHANFIINDQQASAKDIEDLILLAQATVWKKFRVRLETEVRIIGEVES